MASPKKYNLRGGASRSQRKEPEEGKATKTDSVWGTGLAFTDPAAQAMFPAVAEVGARIQPSDSTIRTRMSTWLTSLKSLLQKQFTILSSRATRVRVPPSLASSVDVPQTVEELDKFLQDIWEQDTATTPEDAPSPYVRSVTQLRDFFLKKEAEMAMRLAAYMEELTTDPTLPPLRFEEAQMRNMLLWIRVKYRFEELKIQLKQEVAQTVLELQDKLSDHDRKKRSLPSRVHRILGEWFDAHVRHPYPNKAAKEELAAKCGIAVSQVTNWFSNKRTRNTKAMKSAGSSKGKK